jgi:hypothetical protein
MKISAVLALAVASLAIASPIAEPEPELAKRE